MTEPQSESAISLSHVKPTGPNPLLVILGIVFIAGWIGLWLIIALACGAMPFIANFIIHFDSGQIPAGAHVVSGLFDAQVLAALAGIPAGLAFFWHAKRGFLFRLFTLLFALSILWQWWSVHSSS